MYDEADESPSSPPIDPELFEHLRQTLDTAGPEAAVAALCERLLALGDYANLFFARLTQARLRMGVCSIPTGPAKDLPERVHDEYEEAIRQAGREVGGLFLQAGQIPRAWGYFKMLGEPEPVREAIERYQPTEGEDTQGVIDVAFQQGVAPRRGFDLLLDRYGICTGITVVAGYEFPHGPEVRAYCVDRLIHALHAQLTERLRNEILARGETVASGASISDLIADRPWLFADDLYHVDVSHLAAVVQMAGQLTAGPGLEKARELCVYGQRLSPQIRGQSEPPFEDVYRDHAVMFDILCGRGVEAGLAHFAAKVAPAAAEGLRAPAEVMVNLYARVGQYTQALAVAAEYLADAPPSELNCPSLLELAQKAGDYGPFAEAARRRGDPVHFLAGLIEIQAK